MRVVKTVAAMRRLAGRWKTSASPTALVPTMGCLHAGHASLIARARRACGPRGKVIVSVFVNPTQFGPNEDFSRYPRDLRGDLALCRKAGADAVFAPSVAEMYPPNFSAFVDEERLSRSMEGASRPGHFRGVATVVAKLWNIIQPDAAIFGAKDFQQAAVVKRTARDLNFPLEVVVAPTVREKDGLALSSRNRYLNARQRAQATVLWRAIQAARAHKKPAPAAQLHKKIRALIAAQPEARLDYAAFFDPDTFAPASVVRPGTHIALAVRFGKTRLIDNARL